MNTAQEIYEASKAFSADDRKRLLDSISGGIAADASLDLMMLMGDISCLPDAEKAKLADLLATAPAPEAEPPAQPAPAEPEKPTPAPQPQEPAGQPMPTPTPAQQAEPAPSPLPAEPSRVVVEPSSSGIGLGAVISVLLVILMLAGAGIGWYLYTQHAEEARLAMEAEQKAQQELKASLERERLAKEKALQEQQQLQTNLKLEEQRKQLALQREQEIQERLAAERRRADEEAAARREAELKRAEQEAAARREAELKRAEQEAAAQMAALDSVSSRWDAAINSLSARSFSDEYSRLLQRRLLSALKNIRDGGNVNDVIPNANGTTALHNACGLGEYEIVQLLLENGADVSLKTAKGASVRTCVGNDPGGRIDTLLRRYETATGSVATRTPSTSSSSEDRSDLQPLIDRMARLKCKQAISAYQQGYLLRMLPQIRDGADVDMTTSDSGGHTALHYAVGIGSLSITKWLVNHGANVNARADNGDTPLGSVGQDNRNAIIKLLRDHGAGEEGSTYTPSPSPYNGNRSDLQPLIDRMAALRCKHESSKLYQKRLLMLLPMIRDGADVNITTVETKGNTALHYAVGIGSLSITKWLLEHGANPNAVTDKGASVLQCVGPDNRQQITDLLEQYGAR
ncbi:MAG: ankyrin repeat domain-containing protein [Akkermansia sp.]|nr:ankyrin repeat domain-containing protein [Akkermansia sp.]